jgi:hypothetical protein
VALIDRNLAKRRLLRLIDDSKKLVLEDREAAYDAMVASGCVRFALGEASVEEIDSINILQATFLAMRRALAALAEAPDLVLIDGNQVPPALGCRAETIVGGDARSYSIAAASIFAKVTRDPLHACSGGIVSGLWLGDQPRLLERGASRRIEAPRPDPTSSQELRPGTGAFRASALRGRRVRTRSMAEQEHELLIAELRAAIEQSPPGERRDRLLDRLHHLEKSHGTESFRRSRQGADRGGRGRCVADRPLPVAPVQPAALIAASATCANVWRPSRRSACIGRR